MAGIRHLTNKGKKERKKRREKQELYSKACDESGNNKEIQGRLSKLELKRKKQELESNLQNRAYLIYFDKYFDAKMVSATRKIQVNQIIQLVNKRGLELGEWKPEGLIEDLKSRDYEIKTEAELYFTVVKDNGLLRADIRYEGSKQIRVSIWVMDQIGVNR